MKILSRPFVASWLLFFPLAVVSAADLKLASVFTDHAVFQREMAVPIWGVAAAGAEVKVEFAGQTKTGQAGADGRWQVKLDPLAVSEEPRDLVVKAGPEMVKRSDVLVGEVWVGSGQSNMSFAVHEALNPEQEIAAANYPQLRLFTVPAKPSLQPLDQVAGQWTACTPNSVASFSAAAYFFGRELQKTLHVPVGLIHSSVGGTPAEAWMRLEALNTIPALQKRAAQEIAQIQAQPEDNKKFPAERAAWEEKYGVKPPAVADASKGWADPALDTADWKRVKLPATWGQLGFKSGGVFWLRKEIDLPTTAAGKPFALKLLTMPEEYDTAYWNGIEIGHAGDAAPDFYMGQRNYRVPAPQVKAGRNVLAVRIVSATEKVGFTQFGRKLEVPVENPASVDDEWLIKAESSFAPLPAGALAERPKPNSLAARLVSASLYNGMIAPLVPYAIRGVIWYQGEHNAGLHAEYQQTLSLLINDWRQQWGQGDFTFEIQQLVNFEQPPKDANQAGSWPFLREAQQHVSETVPNTGLSVGIEVGSSETIHPRNKQEVGRRLALVALEKVYGQKIESSGPRYQAMKPEGNSIRVSFTHATGLTAKDGPLQRFAIAGADQKFVWADAMVEGESVIVSSSSVTAPVAVRYAWAANPEGCNLYNAAGLPAAPFRTDDWK